MLTELSTVEKKLVVDKHLLKQRFQAAVSTYNTHAVVQQDMAIRLVDLAREWLPTAHKKVLEIGCGTGLLTQELIKYFKVDNYLFNDLVDNAEAGLIPILKDKVQQYKFIGGDAEQIAFPDEVDCICSGATIQWVNKLAGFFQKLSRSLNDHGYMLLSSFGPENYREIRQLTGNGIDYKNKEQIIAAATPEFELLAFDEWQQTIWFENPVQVLKHMRYTGVNSVSHCRWSKGQMKAFSAAYEAYAQLEGYPLTYHPYLMIFKKK